MAAAKFTKGQSVTRKSGADIRYQILTAHRDGTYTVRAMFYLSADGSDQPGFLGYKYRTVASDLAPLPAKQTS